MTVPFKILSLNGGGVRGIFQAVFLKNLQISLGTPLHQQFDLIAGTSTGSIIALALALGIDIDRVESLYREKSEIIFKQSWLPSLNILKKGPRYDTDALRSELSNIFENKQLRDSKTQVIVAATCLDQYCHRVFSSLPTNERGDKELSVVDVALASSAAPIYFEPITPKPQVRSYVDGGLWANSPSLISVLYSMRYLNKPVDSIRVLSVGTGEFSQGIIKSQFNELRTIKTIKPIFEIMFSSQQSAADDQTKILVGEENFYKVSTHLNEFIGLDDAQMANDRLPPLAEQEAGQSSEQIINMLRRDIPHLKEQDEAANEEFESDAYIPRELVEASGLTGFYPSRQYYILRDGAESIDSYVEKATKTLTMVSINLMTGLPFTNLCNVLERKLENSDNDFQALISLLNPNNADLIFAISPALSRTKEQLSISIEDTIKELIDFRNTLSSSAMSRLQLRVHNSIPFGSAILIDHKEQYGRIQIETKPYKAVVNESFAFEIAPHGYSGFYKTLITGYEKLIEDGNTIEEIGLIGETI